VENRGNEIMKIFKTLTLLVIMIALASYVYFIEIKGGEEQEKQKELDEKIFNFESDSVAIVEIRSIFNQFRFERKNDGWIITDPIETGGDKSTVDGLINTMKNIKKVREFTIKDGTQPEYGLVGRSVLVIFQFTNGSRDSIRFGDPTPVNNNIFAGRGDSTVFVLGSYTKENTEKQLFDWRDKSIAKIELNDVREMRIKNSHGQFHFETDGTDWFLKAPRDVKAENPTVNNIIRKFQNDKVKSIVAENFENPKEFRLTKPRYIIDMYLGEGKAHKQIILSSLKDNVAYGKDDSRPYVFTVDSTVINEFDKSFFEMRDKKIVSWFNREKIDSLVIDQGDSTVTLNQDTLKTWWMNDSIKIKGWKINTLLSNMQNLQAEKFLMEDAASTRKYGMNKPDRIVRIFEKGQQIREIHFTSPSSDKNVGFCPDTKIVAEISSTSYEKFEIKVDDYKEEESSGQ